MKLSSEIVEWFHNYVTWFHTYGVNKTFNYCTLSYIVIDLKSHAQS